MSTPALITYLEKEFGGRFTERESVVSVGTTASRVVDHDDERMGLLFQNLGPNGINIALTNQVSATFGLYLVSPGSTASLQARNDLTLVGRGWYAVAPAGTSSLYVLEVYRYAAMAPPAAG